MRGVNLCENHGDRLCESRVMPFQEEEEEEIVSLGDSRIKHVRGRLAILSMLKVRVVDLEYS